jgi:hypothetical protein
VKTKTVWTLLIAGLVVFSVMVMFTGITVAQEDRNAKEVFARTEAAFTKSGELADKGNEVEDPIMVYGAITDGNGDGIVGATVEIKKRTSWWLGSWCSLPGPSGTPMITDSNGEYSTRWIFPFIEGYGCPIDDYRMYVDGQLVAEEYIDDEWVWEKPYWMLKFSYQWDYQIPEFATIALPVASILGLLFFFNHRKRRKE